MPSLNSNKHHSMPEPWNYRHLSINVNKQNKNKQKDRSLMAEETLSRLANSHQVAAPNSACTCYRAPYPHFIDVWGITTRNFSCPFLSSRSLCTWHLNCLLPPQPCHVYPARAVLCVSLKKLVSCYGARHVILASVLGKHPSPTHPNQPSSA